MNLGFTKPVPDGMMIVGGGWRRTPNKHAGLDIRLPQGTPIFAVADGIVTSSSATPRGDLGIYAAITHPTGVVTRYLHFSQLSVTTGQHVLKGQQIGLSGNTGLSSAPHLHFDIKVPSQDVVAKIRDEVGEPLGGFEPNVTGFGVGVPAEPWVPVDRYEPQVVTNAITNGIPLYKPRGADLAGKLTLALLLGLLGGAWLFTRFPHGQVV
jgi:murein DD-endopeptidase MepM/ murein hydrolase activator NlpD